MSRLSTLSPAALSAMFGQESNVTLITLLTIKANPNVGVYTNIYLADNYTTRLSETDADIVYGVTSNGINYTFLPLQVILPSEDTSSAPRCNISIFDATKILLPTLRGISGAVDIDLQLILNSSPNTVEALFTGLKMTNITYNADSINAELTMPSLEVEPFPIHSFTPAYFPGLF